MAESDSLLCLCTKSSRSFFYALTHPHRGTLFEISFLGKLCRSTSWYPNLLCIIAVISVLSSFYARRLSFGLDLQASIELQLWWREDTASQPPLQCTTSLLKRTRYQCARWTPASVCPTQLLLSSRIDLYISAADGLGAKYIKLNVNMDCSDVQQRLSHSASFPGASISVVEHAKNSRWGKYCDVNDILLVPARIDG